MDRLEAVEDEYLTIEAELSDPAVLNDPGLLRQKSKRYKELSAIVELIRARRASVDDAKAVIMEIRGAEGGEEANLFARDLFEMYSGYAAQEGWSLEVLSTDV